MNRQVCLSRHAEMMMASSAIWFIKIYEADWNAVRSGDSSSTTRSPDPGSKSVAKRLRTQDNGRTASDPSAPALSAGKSGERGRTASEGRLSDPEEPGNVSF